MRAAFLVVLLVASGACRRDSHGDPASTRRPDEIAREQARFDAERHPEKVVEALAIGPGSRVADIGAGSGLLTVHLARAVKPNGRVVATDIDGAVLDLLQTRLAAANLSDVVERRVVSAEKPELEAGAYDAILLAEVDHYFSNEVDWLKDAAHALKPKGRIVISNRIHHRPKSMAAAQKAGLKLEAESTPVPTHFIAVFTQGTAVP
ncbi:MAG TPA: class I SAM-dependent methyltransferase [Kofleriaceae bacterium]|nr:class I SAM-dependent methyltransferase [Kofleriaceae bacterium]